MENEIKYRSKRQFFLTNLVRGFAILAVLVLAFIFFKRNLDVESIAWLEPLYSRPGLMFLIYTLSEVLFGIIPPELFMIWATSYESLETYVSILLGLMLISYAAGWFAFWVGKRFRYSSWYRLLKRRYLRKYELYLQEYGSFLIVVAAITPLPFAGVCMLVGSVDYPVRKFLVYSLFRLLRYVVYASIIWEASFF
jgi:membrane protein DedA with SNARE-associated domain